MNITLFLDVYERKARLYPALLLLAPVIATAIAVTWPSVSAVQVVAGAAVACGGAFYLSQVARDGGKRREQKLFGRWGGIPSVTIFRHSDHRLDVVTKARYHMRLGQLTGTSVPTSSDETADEGAADRVYTAWSNYLRARTRDSRAYHLLFKENVNYGYRRNVWGLRRGGFVLCVICCMICGALMRYGYASTGGLDLGLASAFVFAAGLGALWVFQFTPAWVRIPADAYAERLVECVDGVSDASGNAGAAAPH